MRITGIKYPPGTGWPCRHRPKMCLRTGGLSLPPDAKKKDQPFGWSFFLVREAGRRRRKLHIPHPAVNGRARPFRCGSFSHSKRFAGLQWESYSFRFHSQHPGSKQNGHPFRDDRLFWCARRDLTPHARSEH